MNPPYILNRRFRQFDALSQAIHGWDLDWTQLDAGVLNAHVVQAATPQVMLTHCRFGRRFLQRGATPPGTWTFGWPTGRIRELVWCGREGTDEDLLVFSPKGDYEAISEPGFSADTLSYSEEHLRSLAEILELDEMDLLTDRTEAMVRCGREVMGNLRARVQAVLDALLADPSLIGHPAIREELEVEIPSRILIALAAHQQRRQPLLNGSRAECARSARALIESHAHEDLRIREICEALEVSWRTLDYAFRESYGVTPKQYLQSVRLDGVRRELLRAPRSARVGEAALRWGFWHSSQFAKDYRRQFDELPSATLRR